MDIPTDTKTPLLDAPGLVAIVKDAKGLLDPPKTDAATDQAAAAATPTSTFLHRRCKGSLTQLSESAGKAALTAAVVAAALLPGAVCHDRGDMCDVRVCVGYRHVRL